MRRIKLDVWEEEKQSSAKPNLTSFSDIVTSLLIMFMASMSFLVESGFYVQRGARARSKKKPLQAREKKKGLKLVLNVNADGTLDVGDKKGITKEEAEPILKTFFKKAKLIIFRAEGDASYEYVVEIIDWLYQVNYEAMREIEPEFRRKLKEEGYTDEEIEQQVKLFYKQEPQIVIMGVKGPYRCP